MIERRRRADVGKRIVTGYETVPQTEAELRLADAAARRMIEEEPW